LSSIFDLNLNLKIMNVIYLIGFGGMELAVIFGVILLLFGGKKIPELMRGLGKGIREFNAAKAQVENEIKIGIKEADKPKETPKIEE